MATRCPVEDQSGGLEANQPNGDSVGTSKWSLARSMHKMRGAEAGSGRSPPLRPPPLLVAPVTVVATLSGKQAHSEGQRRSWSAVYHTGGPTAESPLSQGPRPVFVKTLYTLSV